MYALLRSLIDTSNMRVIAIASLSLALTASSLPLSTRASPCGDPGAGPLVAGGKLVGITSYTTPSCAEQLTGSLEYVISDPAPINDESQGSPARDTAALQEER